MKNFIIFLAAIVALSSCSSNITYEDIDTGRILYVKKNHKDRYINVGDTIIMEVTLLPTSYYRRTSIFGLYKGQALPESVEHDYTSGSDTLQMYTYYTLARKIGE